MRKQEDNRLLENECSEDTARHTTQRIDGKNDDKPPRMCHAQFAENSKIETTRTLELDKSSWPGDNRALIASPS